VSSYIGIDESLTDRYNDIPLEQDPECLDMLVHASMLFSSLYFTVFSLPDIPPLLARHVAHLFVRDPLVIYSKKIELDNTKYSDHFENLQSTNWQSCRFKPPPVGQGTHLLSDYISLLFCFHPYMCLFYVDSDS
jgi:glutamate--cysteine ligase catalytic subunit